MIQTVQMILKTRGNKFQLLECLEDFKCYLHCVDNEKLEVPTHQYQMNALCLKWFVNLKEIPYLSLKYLVQIVPEWLHPLKFNVCLWRNYRTWLFRNVQGSLLKIFLVLNISFEFQPGSEILLLNISQLCYLSNYYSILFSIDAWV